MAVDPARASLVTQDYRYVAAPAPSKGAAIKAAYPLAPTIEIDTNLDQAGATALANDLANATDTFVRTFAVGIGDVLYTDDFTDGAPRWLLDFPRYASAGGVYSTTAATFDYFNGTGTLKVRGS